MHHTKITFAICVLQFVSAPPIRPAEKDEVPPSDWMAHLPQKMTDVSLAQIAIPGTHNSGTYSIAESSAISPDISFEILTDFFGYLFGFQIFKWSVTQKTNFARQLQFGIRYFDFRVALKRDTCKGLLLNSSSAIYPCFHIVHGQYANRVDQELEVIKNFLIDHPKEVVIIDFQHFYQVDEKIMWIFKEMTQQIFGDMLEPYRSQIPSLAELWSRRKQVILIGYKKALSSREVGVSLLWPRFSIRQPWPNTKVPKSLRKFLNEKYSVWMERSNQTNFFVFQGILSPDLEFILFNDNLGVEELAKQANEVVETWLDSLNSLRGIVITDFSIVGFPNFTRRVFTFNW